MTKNLTITIEGKSGSGKTHIAAYLRRILYRDGFDVIVDDPDLTEENIDVTGTKDIIHAMKSSISIEIKTKQLMRPATQNGCHPTHELEWRHSSHYEFVCVNCNTADSGTGGWGKLADPCTKKLDNTTL